VRVPGAGSARAMLDLDETHATLDKPPRGEHLFREVGAVGQVESVQRFRFGRFAGKIDRFGDGTLHAERQFVARDAGGERRILRLFGGPDPVQFSEQIDADRLGGRRERPFGAAEIERIVRVHSQRNRVMGRPEVVTVLLVPILAVANRDELRQFVVERT